MTVAVARLVSVAFIVNVIENKKPIRSFQDLAESNETIVSLTQAKDLYSSLVDLKVCERLIDIYDKISRQCYNLALAWDKFSERKSRAQPKDGTRNEWRNR